MLIPPDPDTATDPRPRPCTCLASGLMRLVLNFYAFSKITGLFSHAPQTAHSEIGDCPASIKETRGGRATPSHDLDINTPRMNSMLATSRASSPAY